MCSTTKQMALVGKLYKLMEKLYEERGMDDLFFEHSVAVVVVVVVSSSRSSCSSSSNSWE